MGDVASVTWQFIPPAHPGTLNWDGWRYSQTWMLCDASSSLQGSYYLQNVTTVPGEARVVQLISYSCSFFLQVVRWLGAKIANQSWKFCRLLESDKGKSASSGESGWGPAAWVLSCDDPHAWTPLQHGQLPWPNWPYTLNAPSTSMWEKSKHFESCLPKGLRYECHWSNLLNSQLLNPICKSYLAFW